MAIPSLAMIPSGYKATKLYSVLPTDGVGDFTVARASTATRVNSAGLIETVGADVPRLDYSDGGCPVLLTEPQSTNEILYSTDFLNASWNQNTADITLSTNLSPDGTLNAYRVEFNNVGDRQLGTSKSTSIGVEYTSSIYARSISGSSKFYIVDVNNVETSFDITSEWKRFELTSTSTSTFLRSYFRLHTIGDVVEFYGAQTEPLGYASSLIKTEGTAITRVGDVVNQAGDVNTFSDVEGTLFVDTNLLANALTANRISVSDGSFNNRISIALGAVLNRIEVFISSSNGATSAYLQYNGATITDKTKIAVTWKLNEFKLWVNGSVRSTDNTSNTPINLDTLQFTAANGTSNTYSGEIRNVQYFNTVLEDAEVTTLTTL